MSSTQPDDTQLLIRCPSCGQRFRVAEDLRGRTVECGGCEHRFRINHESIVRGKKAYPGERKNAKLNRFQRVPLAMVPSVTGFTPMHYADAPDPRDFEPTGPERVIAGFIAVGGMVLMGLLLIFGGRPGGMLDGMATDHRLVMAGFTGLLGIAMLVYANPRARLKSSFMGLLLSALLLGLPFFFREGSVPLGEFALESASPVGKSAQVTEESEELTRLRNQIGTRPLETEIARLARDGGSKQAYGLWLKGLREENRILVRDYLLRVTGADPSSHFYLRDGGDFLMVLTGITQSIDEVADLTTALGTLEKVHREISVLEIYIRNESFTAGSMEKLTDPNGAEFYDLNKKELESIDLDRVLRAVQRLAEVEPKIYRDDISRKLLTLLESSGISFKGDLCDALAVWSEQPGPAGEAALKEAKSLLARKAQVPPAMISLLVKEKTPDGLPLVDELWARSPLKWESFYGDYGSAAEPLLIRRFPETEGMHRQSAVRLLGRVGGADSLPVLAAAAAGANAEMKVLLEKSTAAIQSRIKR